MKRGKYFTSAGWAIDLRILHTDDAQYIRQEEDADARQTFIDQCFTDYLAKGKDIRSSFSFKNNMGDK